MNKAFGNRLRQARISEGLSLIELSEKLGFSPVSVSKWERGTIKPQLEQVKRLERVLGNLQLPKFPATNSNATPPAGGDVPPPSSYAGASDNPPFRSFPFSAMMQ